jgi:hypothetical protein
MNILRKSVIGVHLELGVFVTFVHVKDYKLFWVFFFLYFFLKFFSG